MDPIPGSSIRKFKPTANTRSIVGVGHAAIKSFYKGQEIRYLCTTGMNPCVGLAMYYKNKDTNLNSD